MAWDSWIKKAGSRPSGFYQAFGIIPRVTPADGIEDSEFEELKLMSTLSFGKHAGKELSDVPGDYLQWLIDSRRKELADFEGELKRRELVEAGSLSIGEQILVAGYKALSKLRHPDAGGSDAQQRELNAAYEQLKVVMKQVKEIVK